MIENWKWGEVVNFGVVCPSGFRFSEFIGGQERKRNGARVTWPSTDYYLPLVCRRRSQRSRQPATPHRAVPLTGQGSASCLCKEFRHIALGRAGKAVEDLLVEVHVAGRVGVVMKRAVNFHLFLPVALV